MTNAARPRPVPADSGQFAIAEAIRAVSEAQGQTAAALNEIQRDQRGMRGEVQDVRERMIRIESKDNTAQVDSQISDLRGDIKQLETDVTVLKVDKQRREGASAALRFAKDYLPGVSMLVAAIVVILQAGGLP